MRIFVVVVDKIMIRLKSKEVESSESLSHPK